MNPLLAQEISTVLQRIGTTCPALGSASRAEMLYEGFVFSCVVEALTLLNATFEVRNRQDIPVSTIVFRTKPGLIYTVGAPYTFVFVQVRNREYELHSDLRVEGRSKVLHELDVTLLDRDEAVRCRLASVSPRPASVKLLAECKFYGHSLPLHLGREFLGLSSEYSLRVKTIVSNVRSGPIDRMMTSHRGTQNFDVSPMRPEMVRRFIEWLAKELEHAL